MSLSPRNSCLAYPSGESTYRWADLPTDFPDTPWALFLTDRQRQFHLLGIDLDDHDGTSGAAVAADLALLRSVLDKLELPYLICASGGGDGRHLWLHCQPTSPVVVARINHAIKALCPTFDVHPMANPSTGCLRAPGSPHRDGGASTVLPHGDHLTGLHALKFLAANPVPTGRIDALADELASKAQPIHDAQARHNAAARTQPAAPARETAASARTSSTAAHISTAMTGLAGRRLQPFAEKMLAAPPAADASRTSHTIARSFVYAGRSADDFVRAALVDNSPGLEHIRTRRACAGSMTRTPRPDAEGYARHPFDRALASIPVHQLHRGDAASTAASTHRDEVEKIALTAVQIAWSGSMWTGPSGAVLHRTLAALAAVSIARGRRTVTLSSRSWAMQSGLTAAQVSQASRTLEDAGWIECVHPAAGPLAAQWQIVDRTGAPQWVTHFSNTGGAQGGRGKHSSPLSTARQLVEQAPESGRHNCWTLPGVGTTGHAIWLALTVEGPLSIPGLAGRLGLDSRTVVKTIRVLQIFDLVRSCGGDTLRALPVDRANSHCALLGLEGTQQTRWARYVEESTLWAVRCAERVWRTSHNKHRLPDEVVQLRSHVCVDRPVFRSESSFPRAVGVPLERLCVFAQTWRRRLVDRTELTVAEHALIGSIPASDPSPPPPGLDRRDSGLAVAA